MHHSDFELVQGESIPDRLVLSYDIEIDYPNPSAIADWVEDVSGRDGFVSFPFIEIDTLSTTNYVPKARTATRYEHRWIVNAHGDLKNARREAGGKAVLVLTIELNMTRFLANQPERNLLNLDALTPQDLFLQDGELLRAARAATLVGDNFLLGTARRGGTCFAHRDDFNRQMLDGVTRGLFRLLAESLVPDDYNGLPRNIGVRIRPPVVSQAEVYWEFHTDSSLSAVGTVADRMSMASNQVKVRTYLPDSREITIDGEQNGMGVSIALSDAVRVTIYAKTPTVIRLEIKYLKNLRNNAARSLRGPQTVAAVLDAVHRDAFKRMNRIRDAFMQIAPHTDERADLLDFLRSIDLAAAGDHARRKVMLELLFNRGSVCETIEEGFAPPSFCARLVHSGIIERVTVRHGGEQRYVLTAPYRSLVCSLMVVLPSQIALQDERNLATMQ
ncbi:hypothetical protein ELI15_15335 [Rhizobium ruizarguesonis]|nr:hypothetical protein [Rhizobium ruizarguesonis]TAV33699.1 hypothetical protein ELI36_15305 [Rhizobium ruizarguesonis]TAW65654.1 hypothetical protein ELI15_15335 [Rhizobium ruizarguesonis]TAZ57674.1 hypothetical protein ELH71_15400 [Rhizobium ruizarguesonis]